MQNFRLIVATSCKVRNQVRAVVRVWDPATHPNFRDRARLACQHQGIKRKGLESFTQIKCNLLADPAHICRCDGGIYQTNAYSKLSYLGLLTPRVQRCGMDRPHSNIFEIECVPLANITYAEVRIWERQRM